MVLREGCLVTLAFTLVNLHNVLVVLLQIQIILVELLEVVLKKLLQLEMLLLLVSQYYLLLQLYVVERWVVASRQSLLYIEGLLLHVLHLQYQLLLLLLQIGPLVVEVVKHLLLWWCKFVLGWLRGG